MNAVIRIAIFFWKKLFLVSVAISFIGCASSYKPFNLRDYNYHSQHNILDSLSITYTPNLQRISDNGWYAKKERKYNMTALAVKIENTSSIALRISENDLQVKVGGQAKRIIGPEEYSFKIKQRVGAHLLHTLYGPWIVVSTYDQNGQSDTDIYPIPIGAVIGIINATKAKKANRANAADIRRLQIWNKVINPGEAVYGVILVQGDRYDKFVFSPSE